MTMARSDAALLKQSCVTCHSASAPAAGLMLDKLDVDQIGRDAEVWEKIARKIRTGLHPAASPDRPAPRTLGAFAEAIEHSLDRLDAVNWSGSVATPVSDNELASRLAAFLWRSWPDAELLDLAASRRLSQPAVLEKQMRRMLQDPRADAFFSNFFNQWLLLRNVATLRPSRELFPDFDE